MIAEKRKLQKTGIATYTVSLPKAWITRNKLKAGDGVSIIEEKDKSLRISLSEEDGTISEARIDAGKFRSESEVIRKFTSYYLSGVQKITISFNPQGGTGFHNQVLNHVRRFIGLEIVEENETGIVVQDFFSSDYLSIEKSIRRAYNISRLVFKEAYKILSGADGSINNVMLWEGEVDRLHLLVRRQLNFAIHSAVILRQLDLTLDECENFLLLIVAIEKITDSFVEIAKAAERGGKLTKTDMKMVQTLHDSILESYDQVLESIFKKDFQAASRIIDRNKELVLMFPLEKESKTSSTLWAHLIIFNLHRSINRITDMAEIGMDIQ